MEAGGCGAVANFYYSRFPCYILIPGFSVLLSSHIVSCCRVVLNMDNSTHPTTLDTMLLLPQEVILHISKQLCYNYISWSQRWCHLVSYLDFPELEIISVVSPLLSRLAYDPILSRNRILVVAASRVDHGLFGGVQLGDNFRPTIPDLIQRNVLRGLGLERRWRMGLYFYSSQVRIRICTPLY